MTTKQKAHRWGRGHGWWVWTALLLMVPRCMFGIQTTSVQGVVYRADGTIAQGTILISWPSFTAADGSAIEAGNTSTVIAADGTVNLALAPNSGATPAGTYYTVVYHLSDGTVQHEYWVVPQTATATIGQMRARVVPAAMAQLGVSQQYVDAALLGLQSSFLQLKGGTMNGTLNLAADPTSPLQAATKEYVDAHSGSQLPQLQTVIAGSGNGGAVALPEKGVTVTGSSGSVAWEDDFNAGIYDPRDPRWAGGIDGPTPAAALQAMSNQMACDLHSGAVQQAIARLPQGQFPVAQLVIAPGSTWEGVRHGGAGTTFYATVNNVAAISMPVSMTVACNGSPVTWTADGTNLKYVTINGCSTGGCSNAAGDSGNYASGGPNNVGLNVQSLGATIDHVWANNFGGPGIQFNSQDGRALHIGGLGDLAWYYWGNYKGYQETLASPETSVTTTGTTGAVNLAWSAVPNATAYAVYRGSTSGGENAFFITTTNSFVDTGTAGNNTGYVNTAVTSTAGAPGSITATASTTGGSLAAGTYYYVVTSLTNDGWHGAVELVAIDLQADWAEVYGMQDLPNQFNYHHLADIIADGSNSHFGHMWPQLGQVGIYVPDYFSQTMVIDNFRIDGTRLEGLLNSEYNVRIVNGEFSGGCQASNAQSLAGNEWGYMQLPNKCTTLIDQGQGDVIDNIRFLYPSIFGPTYKTADYAVVNVNSYVGDVGGAVAASGYPMQGIWAGGKVVNTDDQYHAISGGGSPYLQGQHLFYFTDTSSTTYSNFQGIQNGALISFLGGNSDVTLVNNNDLKTCTGQNLNMGSFTGLVQFQVTGIDGFGATDILQQVCNTPAVSASSETIAFSTTPIFSTLTQTSQMTLTGNVTSFTLGAGMDGQVKTLIFCQDATGGRTMIAPANVRGFFNVGTTANKCSSQQFTYAAGQSAWLASSPGVTNE